MSPPKYSNEKKRRNFTKEEIHLLLSIWSDPRLQRRFNTTLRHNLLWEEIATMLTSEGYERTGPEVKAKINNLKQEYKKNKPSPDSPTSPWPFYDAIHKIVGQSDMSNFNLVHESSNGVENVFEYEMGLDNGYVNESEEQHEDGQVPGCSWMNVDEISANSSTSYKTYASLTTAAKPPDTSQTPITSNTVQSPVKSTAAKRPRYSSTATSPAAIIPATETNETRTHHRPRPPERSSTNEDRLIDTLIESEKRAAERYAYIQERDQRTEEREDRVADSMCRFFDNFSKFLNNQVLPTQYVHTGPIQPPSHFYHPNMSQQPVQQTYMPATKYFVPQHSQHKSKSNSSKLRPTARRRPTSYRKTFQEGGSPSSQFSPTPPFSPSPTNLDYNQESEEEDM